ncbi:MAG: tyrosine-type recombinase/integrase [Hyphomicrobiaceae bacterium]
MPHSNYGRLARGEAAAVKADTFADLALLYIERHAQPQALCRPRRAPVRVYMGGLHRHRVAEIERAHIVDVIEAVANRDGTPLRQADAVLVLLRTIFNWAISEGLAARNPTEGVRRRAEPTVKTRALSDDELVTLYSELPRHLDEPRWIAVRLMLLTGARMSEVLNATAGEFKDGVWRLPAERSKNGHAHVLPLPASVQRLVARALELSGGDRLLKPYSNSAFRKPFAKLSLEHFSLHDLRRTCASGMARIGVERLTISKVLNHRTADRLSVTGLHYDHHDYMQEKHDALARWATYVDGLTAGGARVVPFRPALAAG